MHFASTRAMISTLTLASILGAALPVSACPRSGYSYRPHHAVTAAPSQTTVVTQTSVTHLVVAPPKPVLREVPSGSRMRIKVNFLGNETGHVFLHAAALVMECQILKWTPTFVEFDLPAVGILEPTPITIAVTKSDGTVARSSDVLLTPTQDIEILEVDVVVPRAARSTEPRGTFQTGGLSAPPAPSNELLPAQELPKRAIDLSVVR